MTTAETSEHTVDSHTSDAITVLLVDDNEQWVELLANDLERESRIETTIALSANEALLSLNETDTIECVVADFRMPEIDGLQLLERVRAERSMLPFILLTGMGSEEIASRAIRAGVSDYVRKDPKTDQTPILINRIRQSVEQHRLREELAESEQRYRTITEQIWDALVVVRDGHIHFCNERLATLTGLDRESLTGLAFVDELVHPADRGDVRHALDGTGNGDIDVPLREARLVTVEGRVLDCEYTLGTITVDGDPATIVSIRDVTARRTRERNLEREREINRVVQNALVESRTRVALETEIAELLHEFGYDLVWFGEPVGSRLQPTAVRGADRYVEGIDLSMDGERASTEPSVWTARSGEPRFAGDFEEMFPTEWRDLALECGFHTGAALPLQYEDVTYGVLAVYHADPLHIDGSEQTLLTQVSTALAFAIHHLDLKKALSAAHIVDVELQLTETAYYLTSVAADRTLDVSNVAITVDGTHPYGDDEVIQYVTLDGVTAGTFIEVATDHPDVREATVIHDGDRPRIQLSLRRSPPEMTLASHGAVVRSTTVTPNTATIRFDLTSRSDLGDVIDAMERSHGSATVRSVLESTRNDGPVGVEPLIESADLTEKQAAALRAAYHHGYFEQPRKGSAKEIAASLGVVHSTYLQHLRAAQQKLFGALYAPERSVETDERNVDR